LAQYLTERRFGPGAAWHVIPAGRVDACSFGEAGKELPMSRAPLFNSPYLLGFDELERLLDRTAKSSSDGYPPYNIEQVGQDGLRITLAVAGFTESDLSVTVEDRQLVIRGKQTDDGSKVFLHRGIAARQFQRSFVLAEGIDTVGATLDNGLLHVDLVRPPAESRQRVIEITRNGGRTADNPPSAIEVENVKG
jgi:HSP20 family molecular chaperone IbpA